MRQSPSCRPPRIRMLARVAPAHPGAGTNRWPGRKDQPAIPGVQLHAGGLPRAARWTAPELHGRRSRSSCRERAPAMSARDPVLRHQGELDRARTLLALVRDTMIDSGDHEALAQSISRLAEARPREVEPLEWLVDLYGRASDSFRLPDALAQLAQAYEFVGD